uniref:Uncharacterized protein n=1 Tax=Bionectria ochroleuca TaxID=29856 RepID=A0A8H7K318_BIOOC
MPRILGQAELSRRIIAAIRHVDRIVLSSDHVQNIRGTETNEYNYWEPEAALQDLDDITYWNIHFQFLLQEWDEDRLPEAAFNFYIDQLSVAADMLDRYGPRLVRAYRRLTPVPELQIQGILNRRAVLNAFLNSSEIALEHWYRNDGWLDRRTVRPRRPSPEQDGVEPDQSDDDDEHTPVELGPDPDAFSEDSTSQGRSSRSPIGDGTLSFFTMLAIIAYPKTRERVLLATAIQTFSLPANIPYTLYFKAKKEYFILPDRKLSRYNKCVRNGRYYNGVLVVSNLEKLIIQWKKLAEEESDMDKKILLLYQQITQLQSDLSAALGHIQYIRKVRGRIKSKARQEIQYSLQELDKEEQPSSDQALNFLKASER